MYTVIIFVVSLAVLHYLTVSIGAVLQIQDGVDKTALANVY